MISSTNINGMEYKVVSSEELGTHSVGDLPEGLRIHISSIIEQGLAKNRSTDEIMDNIVLKGQDGQYYLKTAHDDLLLTIDSEVVEAIRSIMTGDDEE